MTTLISGIGNREDDQLCVMSLTAKLAGEDHTDHPTCACPVLTEVAIVINDGPWWDSDEERTATLTSLAHKMLHSKTSREAEQQRAEVFVRLAIHTFAPMELRAVGLDEHAEKLEKVDFSKGFKAAVRAAARAADAADAAAHYATYAASRAADAAYHADAFAAHYATRAAAYHAARAAAYTTDAANANRKVIRDLLLNTLMEQIKNDSPK